jgi:magnesium transporter
MQNTKIIKKEFLDFVWIDVSISDQDSIELISKDLELDIHQIKDSIEHGHLPKFEKLEDYNFLILRAFTSKIKLEASTVSELSNKIAFFYNSNKIITIHRKNFEFLEKIPDNLKSTDNFLFFVMLKMIQTYNLPLEELDDQIDIIEETIFLNDNSGISLKDLYLLKNQARIIKKLLQISQSAVYQLEISEDSLASLQDIKDKFTHLILRFDEILENSHNLLNTFLSVNSQKTNEVMKLLTIFSVFFLPLTFIVGIYGMNFENMPEISMKYGYYYILGSMIIISFLIFVWFKRKKII